MLGERLGLNLTDAEEAKLFDFEDEPVRMIIDEFNHALTDEVARTIDYVIGQNPERSVQGVYYCGGGSRLSGLVEELEAKLTAPVAPLNPVQNLSGSGADKRSSHSGASVLGFDSRRVSTSCFRGL
jgi:Tfp pilus assembly PilM family ATPase